MALWALLAVLSLSCTVEGSFKKGTCAYPGNLLCDDFKVLNNMSWWYDWHMDLSFYYDQLGQHCNGTNRLVPKHIPMVKTYNNHTNLTIQTWGKFVLGFNEPDREAHGNLTPQQAADAWPEIEKNSHGAKLVSPAVASPKFTWYDEFFRLCNGCRVDFVAAHVYKCNAHRVMTYLQELYQRYGKKVWLTEFACPQTHDENKQLHLMQTLLPQLEAADYVFRYDWHMDLSFYHDKIGQYCNWTSNLVHKHVPMVKKYNNHTQLTIQTWGKFILGFNEPDHADQANMTAQEAADAWPEIEKNSHGAKLVSPTTAGPNFRWYDEFFRLCHGCRIDFIAAHMYRCDAREIMSYLQKLYHRYNKKIWLTEFACPQTHDVNKQLHLMKTLLPQLEAADYVFRYSWFSARIPLKRYDRYVTNSASLLQPNASELTVIGQYYNNFHVPHHHSNIIG